MKQDISVSAELFQILVGAAKIMEKFRSNSIRRGLWAGEAGLCQQQGYAVGRLSANVELPCTMISSSDDGIRGDMVCGRNPSRSTTTTPDSVMALGLATLLKMLSPDSPHTTAHEAAQINKRTAI
jgi:hypothetical protein